MDVKPAIVRNFASPARKVGPYQKQLMVRLIELDAFNVKNIVKTVWDLLVNAQSVSKVMSGFNGNVSLSKI